MKIATNNLVSIMRLLRTIWYDPKPDPKPKQLVQNPYNYNFMVQSLVVGSGAATKAYVFSF